MRADAIRQRGQARLVVERGGRPGLETLAATAGGEGFVAHIPSRIVNSSLPVSEKLRSEPRRIIEVGPLWQSSILVGARPRLQFPNRAQFFAQGVIFDG